MMFGSIFYNCWAALITFAFYFLVTLLQNVYSPSRILLGSSMTAFLAFVLMFAVRLFIGYVLYTPKEALFDEMKRVNDAAEHVKEDTKQNTSNNKFSTVEFEDEDSEQIAKVVRKMMSFDDSQPISNK